MQKKSVKSEPQTKTFWPAVINGAAVTLFYIALNWNTFAAPFERDEGEYAYSAWITAQGMVPYLDTFLHKPPLTIFTYLLGYLISPGAVWPVHVIGGLFLLATALLLGWCAKKLYGRLAGFAVPWLFIALMATPAVYPFAANTEKFMLLPMTAVLALFISKGTHTARQVWFWAGFLSATALLFKPICLFVLVLLHGVWFYEVWRHNRTESVRHASLVLAGGVAATALVCGYFIARGAGGPLWELNVKFNSQMAVLLGEGSSALVTHIKELAVYWWAAGLLCIGYFYKRPSRWLFLGGLLLCAFLAVYRDANGHYYILLIPFIALAGAGFLSTMNKKAAVLVCAGAVIANIAPMVKQVRYSPRDFILALYRGNPFAESVDMAQKLREYTTDSDEVLIGGSEPQILYYAKRKSATRFVIMYPLMYATPSAEKYQGQAIDELADKKIKAVVVARTGASWMMGPRTPELFMPFFTKYLTDYDFEGGYATEDGKTYWLTGPANEDKVLLALYIRKP